MKKLKKRETIVIRNTSDYVENQLFRKLKVHKEKESIPYQRLYSSINDRLSINSEKIDIIKEYYNYLKDTYLTNRRLSTYDKVDKISSELIKVVDDLSVRLMDSSNDHIEEFYTLFYDIYKDLLQYIKQNSLSLKDYAHLKIPLRRLENYLDQVFSYLNDKLYIQIIKKRKSFHLGNKVVDQRSLYASSKILYNKNSDKKIRRLLDDTYDEINSKTPIKPSQVKGLFYTLAIRDYGKHKKLIDYLEDNIKIDISNEVETAEYIRELVSAKSYCGDIDKAEVTLDKYKSKNTDINDHLEKYCKYNIIVSSSKDSSKLDQITRKSKLNGNEIVYIGHTISEIFEQYSINPKYLMPSTVKKSKKLSSGFIDFNN